jgi:hypothetical protein
MDIAAERELLESRLQQLHAERGTALLEGRKFDSRRLDEVHERMAALDDAQAAQANINRDEAARLRQVEVGKLQHDASHYGASAAKVKAAADKLLAEWEGMMALYYQHLRQQGRTVGRLNALTGAKESAPNIQQLQNADSLVVIKRLRSISESRSRYGNIPLSGATKTL